MAEERIAIVGAGVAGLAAARAMTAAGLAPVIFDKGRRPGGRLATRTSRNGPAFDHGAQYLTARGEGFAAFLAEAGAEGQAAEWGGAGAAGRFVGTPCMAALADRLALGLDVRSGVEVTALKAQGRGFTLAFGAEEAQFDRIVLTLPAPQAARLLGDHPLTGALGAVEMAPCLTLMAEFAPGAPAPFAAREDRDADLAFIAHDGGKPGHGGGPTWVAQAGEAWSHAHLEAEKPEIAALLLPLLAEAIGRAPGDAVHAIGHRWRYARVTTPLGAPFLADGSGRLFLGGDWCLGARVEAAFDSGVALAAALIDTLTSAPR